MPSFLPLPTVGRAKRRGPALGALVLSAALALGACGDVSERASDATPATPAATASPVKPLTGVDCSTLTIDSDSPALPAVSGDPGAQPTLTWSGQAAPANLTVKTLNEGTGDAVASTDVVTASYVGWEWGGNTAFDSSYKRGAPTPFSLQQVVPGWTCGLAGHRVGERVLMSIPPELGYGQGIAKPGSGKPEGPLVFVVEIVSKTSPQDVDSAVSTATPEGEDKAAARGITVTGAPGTESTISVASGATEPTEPEVIVLARGTGQPLTANSTVAANVAYSTWDGSRTGSTWKDGGLQTVNTAQIKGLEGVPAGSRVIVLTPPARGGSAPSLAYVMDLGKAL
ncbi:MULTISPECIES: FKBP-type peptidyl-prolyl cis-trans isomerase [Actinomyces]|uniref:FKBP-type peptidyl-prolyl cis-trans isomerase n=1 Tax=Actinomyces TaxID=1654 RepID=UPI001F17B30E|nr:MULTISPECIES: FKBP-type peptidyl-prolyl cis-trans isomerase [Actinomyces]